MCIEVMKSFGEMCLACANLIQTTKVLLTPEQPRYSTELRWKLATDYYSTGDQYRLFD